MVLTFPALKVRASAAEPKWGRGEFRKYFLQLAGIRTVASSLYTLPLHDKNSGAEQKHHKRYIDNMNNGQSSSQNPTDLKLEFPPSQII